MRGVGGPLLSIGDLLSDVSESPNSPKTNDHHLDHLNFQPSDLSKLFQGREWDADADEILTQVMSIIHQCLHQLRESKREGKRGVEWDILTQDNYDQLNKALAGTDHSWTSLTLKLCTTLDTAKKLIETTNSNVMELSEKVGDLEKLMKKGDSTIAEVRSLHSSLSQRIACSSVSEGLLHTKT